MGLTDDMLPLTLLIGLSVLQEMDLIPGAREELDRVVLERDIAAAALLNK